MLYTPGARADGGGAPGDIAVEEAKAWLLIKDAAIATQMIFLDDRVKRETRHLMLHLEPMVEPVVNPIQVRGAVPRHKVVDAKLECFPVGTAAAVEMKAQ